MRREWIDEGKPKPYRADCDEDMDDFLVRPAEQEDDPQGNAEFVPTEPDRPLQSTSDVDDREELYREPTPLMSRAAAAADRQDDATGSAKSGPMDGDELDELLAENATGDTGRELATSIPSRPVDTNFDDDEEAMADLGGSW